MGRSRRTNARPSTAAPQAAPSEPQGPEAAPVWGLPAVAMAVLLVLLVVAAFSPCLGNDFVTWDDDKNFLENPSYRGLGWSQIYWAWTSFQIGVYQPLAWMILEAEYVLFGLKPWGYHLTSLILYAIDTVVLFLLTLTLLARCRPDDGRAGTLGPALGAGLAVALFAVHPLRTEVVAWASCQPYLPCALFSMLAVLAYLRAFPAGQRRAGVAGGRVLAVRRGVAVQGGGGEPAGGALDSGRLSAAAVGSRRRPGVGSGRRRGGCGGRRFPSRL